MLLTIIFILGLVGCSKNTVQDDLLNYINVEMPKVSELEGKVLKDYESVTGTNYRSDDETYEVIKFSVIPNYRIFNDKLEQISPKTKEVRELHEIYVKAANIQYNAFVQASAALEKRDSNLVSEVNVKLDEARKGVRTYKAKLEELCKKYNVQLKNK